MDIQDKEMEDKINKMNKSDNVLIVGFAIALCTIFCIVILQVLRLTNIIAEKITIVSIGVTVMLLGVAALVGVIRHLERNKVQLYTEDIISSMEGK